MKVQPYNFSKPGRLAGDMEQRLSGWLQAVCALIPKKLAKYVPVEMSFQEWETIRPAGSLARLADTAIGYRVEDPAQGLTALLAVPRPVVLALVGGIMGDKIQELPKDRELTVVEVSLSDYLAQDYWITAFQETWPGAKPLRLELRQKEQYPKWSRIFPADDNVVVCCSTVTGTFGEQEWHWVVPHKILLDQFGHSGARATRENGEEKVFPSRLEAIVRNLPVELTVSLGTLDLPVTQLTRLRAGDVVIFNQRVSEPLTASVAGEKKYRGWAGRVGSRQVFQIESLVGG